ncbi:MAG: DUF4340 domain-containing protein [Phycisphaerae bacterium]|nr:DUF4340 domain-containing protein [Phycisphaerae bacterium]
MKQPIIAISMVAAALVAVAILVKPTVESGETAAATREPLVPLLAPRARDITAIELTQGSKTLRLRKDGDVWTLPDAGSFRAQTARVNELLSALAGLETIEAMTSAKERLGELNLAWPDDQGVAKLARVLAGDAPIAEVVIGKERFSPDAQFARLLGESQAWKCSGTFRSGVDQVQYIDRQLMELAGGDIERFTAGGVEFTRGDNGAWTAAQVEPVAMLPETQRESAQRTIPEVLSRLEIEDVRAAKEHPEHRTVRVISRSRAIELDIAKDGDDLWVKVDVERLADQAEPTDAAEQARVKALDEAGARCAGFEFRLPSWRVTSLSAILFPAPPAPANADQPAPGTQPTVISPAGAP